MNEFKQDYENEKEQWLMDRSNYYIEKIDTVFKLANLLRARYEMEIGRGADTVEFIQMIIISSSFINTENKFYAINSDGSGRSD